MYFMIILIYGREPEVTWIINNSELSYKLNIIKKSSRADQEVSWFFLPSWLKYGVQDSNREKWNPYKKSDK